MKVPLSRKQVAPRNVAAKSLREGQFQPKIEADPKVYKRKNKHKTDPVLEAERQDGEAE
jgi:hypothetical protein